jgi:hypothetical protein
MKFRVVAKKKIRTANPVRMETVRFIFTSDKYLTSYGRDEQKMHAGLRENDFVFNTKFHDNLFRRM